MYSELAGCFAQFFERNMKRLLLAVSLLVCTLALQAQNPDINILKQINVHRNTSLDGMFDGISRSVAPVGLFVPLVFFGGFIKSNGKELKNETMVIAGSLVLSTALSYTLKSVFDRERPYNAYSFIQNPGPPESSSSFPSNHTSIAFSTATSLSLLYPRWYIIVPSYCWAGAVGYSRMHLGVHYPADVLGGMITGAGSAWLCCKFKVLTGRKKPKALKPESKEERIN